MPIFKISTTQIRLSFIVFILLYSFTGFSNTVPDTTTVHNKHVFIKKSEKTFLDKIDKLFPQKNIDNYHFDFDGFESEFTDAKIALEYPTPILVNDLQKKVRSFFGEIDKKEGWVEGAINDDKLTQLPVGLKHIMNEIEYSIGVAKARFTPEYTEILIYARVKLPQQDENGQQREIFFGADKIKLSHDGGIIGDAKLVLLGDVTIPFNGGNWSLTLNGDSDYINTDIADKTYVTIGCDGVKEMGIEGSVQFSRSLILPVDSSGKVLPEKRVRGDFKIVASDWNDILTSVNLNSFVLAKQPDKFVFTLNQAVFDFSDIRNDPEVNFPDYYHDKGLLLPTENNWRGVYVQTFEVLLPKEFKTDTSVTANKRIAIGANDLIIDSNGVSGQFYADNVFPLKEGITSDEKAWAISLDHIGVNIAANHLIKAKFEGEIILPIASSQFKYTGLISEEEYLLTVKTTDTISFDVFSAKAELFENSGIELSVKEGKFLPKAILNGRMVITANQKNTLVLPQDKSIVIFKGIEFQELTLQTVSPYFEAKYVGYKDKGEIKLANFSASLGSIEFISTDEEEAKLSFDIGISLMDKKDKGFAAETQLAIIGKLYEEGRKQKWKYDHLKLEEIKLEASLAAIKLKGTLLLMDDNPEYGDGFSAEIEGTFGKIGPITCKAIFGKKEFKYWYLDAAIHGLKIQTGPVQISGFVGGAYYKMKRRGRGFSSDFSPSGLSYVPDDEYGLGVKSMVYLSLIDEGVVSAAAGFEILFNERIGVSKIGFYGEAQVMKAFEFDNPVAKLTDRLKSSVEKSGLANIANNRYVKKLTDKAKDNDSGEIVGKASISAYMGMEHDFDNNTFHAEFDLYVDVAGGVIQGRASKGRAGWGVFHVDNKEWYLYMGTPDDRLGLKVGIGSFKIEAGGYFMMGHKIPGSPPPHPKVAEILGITQADLDYMRDENALGEGKGFAFGQDFEIDTGDLTALFFYARFIAGGGYDIMLKDYGEAKCKGSNDQIGINGWYANGQAYAYFQGELGIRIKLFFIKKKIPIIKSGAAVLLQVKAPNPFWMRGYMGGNYNLLGGLVKGSFNFKVVLGEECEFVNAAPLGGIKIITDVTPKDEATYIDVFAAPQAAFSLKVNEPIVIPGDEGDKTYKIILEQFKVTDEADKEIIGEIEWNNNKNRVTFISTDVLPPNTKLKATVEVSFQEQVNGVFRTINVDGQKAVELEERNFTTGTAPTVIPLHNIEYAYPVVDQKHFYEGEYNKGYIQLKRGQDYLFDNQTWKSEIDYTPLNGNIKTIDDFSYNNSENKLSYTLPDIKQKEEYKLAINSKPKDRTSNQTSDDQYTSVDTGDTNNTVQVRTNSADNVSQDGVIERLIYPFKTSKYKTFKKKINALSATGYHWGKVYVDVPYLEVDLKQNEGFELVELVGNGYTDDIPLIQVESTLEDDYFTIDINPILYSKYPLNNQYFFTYRDVDEYGVPPSKALRIKSSYLTYLEYDVEKLWRETTFPYYYDLGYFYKMDMHNLKTQVASDYADDKISSSNPARSILDATFKTMRKGTYKINMQYILPGNIKGTQHTFNYKNP